MAKKSQSEYQIGYIFSPLNITSGIEPIGNVPTTQEYDIVSQTYAPDYTTEHLQLALWLCISDPDNLITEAEKTPANIVWSVIEQGLTTTITTSTAGYSLPSSGQIIIKRNINPDSPLTLRCSYDILDPRTGEILHRTDSTLITSESISYPPELILDTPSVIRYDPIRDTTDIRKVKATLRIGDTTAVAPSVRFIWQKRDSYDGIWSDISASELMDYDVSVSADKTELTIKCSLIGRRIDIRCYALYNPCGSAASLTIESTTPVEEFSVVRYEPTLSTSIDMPRHIHPTMKQIAPTAHIFDSKGEIPSPDTHAEIGWKTASGNASGTLTYGSYIARGRNPTIPATFISRQYGGKVKADATIRAPLAALRTSSGSIITLNGSVLLARPSRL